MAKSFCDTNRLMAEWKYSYKMEDQKTSSEDVDIFMLCFFTAFTIDKQ